MWIIYRYADYVEADSFFFFFFAYNYKLCGVTVFDILVRDVIWW